MQTYPSFRRPYRLFNADSIVHKTVSLILLRDLSRPNTFWFQLSIFAVGTGAAIEMIINAQSEQDLKEIEGDVGRAQVQAQIAA